MSKLSDWLEHQKQLREKEKYYTEIAQQREQAHNIREQQHKEAELEKERKRYMASVALTPEEKILLQEKKNREEEARLEQEMLYQKRKQAIVNKLKFLQNVGQKIAAASRPTRSRRKRKRF